MGKGKSGQKGKQKPSASIKGHAPRNRPWGEKVPPFQKDGRECDVHEEAVEGKKILENPPL